MLDDQPSRSMLKALLNEIEQLRELSKQGIEIAIDDILLPNSYQHLKEYKKYGQRVYLDVLYVTFLKKHRRLLAKYSRRGKIRTRKYDNAILFTLTPSFAKQLVVNK